MFSFISSWEMTYWRTWCKPPNLILPQKAVFEKGPVLFNKFDCLSLLPSQQHSSGWTAGLQFSEYLLECKSQWSQWNTFRINTHRICYKSPESICSWLPNHFISLIPIDYSKQSQRLSRPGKHCSKHEICSTNISIVLPFLERPGFLNICSN